MDRRTAGIAGIAGGLGLLAVEIRELIASGSEPLGANIDRVDSIGYMIWGTGMAVLMWGLYRLKVTGGNRFARLAPLVAMAGFVAMAIGSLLDVVGQPHAVSNPLVGIAFPLILLGTLVTGILAIWTETLQGWRRFTPLACVLVIPLLFLLGPYASLLFGFSWVLLGFAVATLPEATPAALGATTVP